MWLTFAAACLASAVVLYAPGYLAGRAVRLGSFGAIAVAPAFSVALLVAMGVLLQAVGIPCPAWALLLGSLSVSLVAYIVFALRVWKLRRCRKGKRACRRMEDDRSVCWCILSDYCACIPACRG